TIHQRHAPALEQERKWTHGITLVKRAAFVPRGSVELADHPRAIDQDAAFTLQEGRYRAGIVQVLRAEAALVQLGHERECAPACRAVEVGVQGITERRCTLLHHP